MWQRFTERARKVVFYAQEEAQRFGEGYVSTEHLLLGLTREPDSVANRVLEQFGLTMHQVRTEVEKQLPRGDKRPSQDMTLTPRAKRVIDLAYDEARNLNNNYIGTEHLLLGLIREGDGLAGRVLGKLGVDLQQARKQVIDLQSAEGGEEAPKGPAARAAEVVRSFGAKLVGRARGVAPAQLEQIRSQLIYVLADMAIANEIKGFVRSLGLAALDWEHAQTMTGKQNPNSYEIVTTALATGGAILAALTPDEDVEFGEQIACGDDAPALIKRQPRQDLVFEAAMALGCDSRRTVLVRIGASQVFSEHIEGLILKLDNSKEARIQVANALRNAGCPVDTSGEGWLTEGEFGAAVES